jgi:hypothetical protein
MGDREIQSSRVVAIPENANEQQGRMPEIKRDGEQYALASKGDGIKIFNPKDFAISNIAKLSEDRIPLGTKQFLALLEERVQQTQNPLKNNNTDTIKERQRFYTENTQDLKKELLRLRDSDPESYRAALTLLYQLDIPFHALNGNAFKGNQALAQNVLEVVIKDGPSADVAIRQLQIALLQKFTGQLFIAEKATTWEQTQDNTLARAIDALMKGVGPEDSRLKDLFATLHAHLDETFSVRQKVGLGHIDKRLELELVVITASSFSSKVNDRDRRDLEPGALVLHFGASESPSTYKQQIQAPVEPVFLVRTPTPPPQSLLPIEVPTLEELFLEQYGVTSLVKGDSGKQGGDTEPNFYFNDSTDQDIRQRLTDYFVSSEALRTVGPIQKQYLDPNGEIPGVRDAKLAQEKLDQKEIV